MKPPARLVRGCFLFGLVFALSTTDAAAQLLSSGYPVKNRKWEILMNNEPYADLILDRRKGFKGREYLSGEWAAAVFYSGGQNPSGPMWLNRQWYFPDWVANTPFSVAKPFGTADPMNPTNSYGYTVYSSVITNLDLRITVTYEMVRFGTNVAEQLVIGLTPKSSTDVVPTLTSGRYAFRQTYHVENISGSALSNVSLYQFLHGLESGFGLYDNRDYGGGMSEFRHRFVQQGTSMSFHSRTWETYKHTDTLSMHFDRMPVAYEVGPFGMKGSDSHEVGKPAGGLLQSVENDTLNGMDYFNGGDDAWVAAAVKFDLGSISAGGSASMSVLLGLHTESELLYPAIDLVIHRAAISNGNYVIDFEEKTKNPVVGYSLHKSTMLNGTPYANWQQVAVPYYINFPQMGWNRFEAPIMSGEPNAFYFVQPRVINPP